MNTVGLRVGVALFAFMFGVVVDAVVNTSLLVEKALAYPVTAVDSVLGSQLDVPPQRATFDSLPSEITFERFQPSCFGCALKRISLRTDGAGASEDALVIETDVTTGHTRHGTLHSYYYHNLLKFMVSQGYFDMSDQYFTGTIESSIVTSSVKVGDRYKKIFTASEGKIPPALWGIHYAIEGVLNHVSWEVEARGCTYRKQIRTLPAGSS